MSAQDAWSSTLLHTSSVSDSSVPLCRFTAASNAFCAICTFLSKDEQMFSNFAGNVQGVGQTKISQFKEDFLPPPACFWRRHSNLCPCAISPMAADTSLSGRQVL